MSVVRNICDSMAKRAAATLLGALMLSSGAHAACPVADNLYALLHPAMTSKGWGRALAETDVQLPDSLCALAPRAVSVAGAGNAGWFVFSSRVSADLHLSSAVWRRPSFICGVPTLTFDTPRKLPISVPAGAAFCVVNHPSFRDDRVLVAAAIAPTIVQVYTVTTSNASITGIATLIVSQRNAAQGAQGLFGDSDTLGGGDNGLWVVGPGGLARHFAFDGSSWGAESVFDIDSSQTVTALGEGFAGTSDGSIFERQGAAFAFSGRPRTSRILGISKSWASAESGTVLLRDGGAWTPYSIGTGALRYGNRIAHGDGSSIELLDTSWNYSLFTYRDTPSRMSSFSDPDAAAAVNSGIPLEVYQTYTLRIGISDPDSNQSPPQVTVGGQSALRSLQGDTLLPRLPHLPAQPGVFQLADTSVTLSILESYAGLSAKALRGAPVAGCTTSFWAADTFFGSARSLSASDTICIALGGDTLLIRVIGQVTNAPRAVIHSSGTPVRLIDATGRQLAIPSGRLTASAVKVDCFDARGRLVVSQTVTEGSSAIRLTSPLPHGFVYVRVTAADGSVAGVSVVLPSAR